MGRPFKGLPLSKGPNAAYDVVIIGAGIAGLICANLLARKGLATLLVESHYMVGGYCSTFNRKGFVFDASSHFYPLLGNPNSITGKLIRDLGVQTEWVKMDPVDSFHFPDGSQFHVPADLDTYWQKLKELFPHEVAAIDAFFTLAKRIHMYGLIYYFKEKPFKQLEPYIPWTLTDALNHFFTDPKLKLLLCADCPHWGSPPDRVSFVFDCMLRFSYFDGNYYPKGGSQRFSDELARCFEAAGGHLLLKSSVTKIIHDPQVQGVELETGPRQKRQRITVRTPKVVSNGDLNQTVQELLSDVDPDYLAHLQQLKPTQPCYLVHIALSGVSHQRLQEIQGYYWQDWDGTTMNQDGLIFKLFSPSVYDPDISQKGQVLIIQKVINPFEAGVDDWQAHKKSKDAFIFEHLARVFPEYKEHMLFHHSASAHTAFRFTHNFKGAMLGWEMSPNQLGEKRPSIHGPIPGLYFTGHWTRPGGGITPVIISAINCAHAISGSEE